MYTIYTEIDKLLHITLFRTMGMGMSLQQEGTRRKMVQLMRFHQDHLDPVNTVVSQRGNLHHAHPTVGTSRKVR